MLNTLKPFQKGWSNLKPPDLKAAGGSWSLFFPKGQHIFWRVCRGLRMVSVARAMVLAGMGGIWWCFFSILEADCLLVDQKFSPFVFKEMYMDGLFPLHPHLTVFSHFINVVNLTIMYLLYSSLLSHNDRWTWPLNEIHKNSFLLKCSCFCSRAP